MAGKITATTLQVNDHATATNNFVLKADNAGGVKLSRGNDGATTQDLITVDSAGNVQLTKTTNQSMVRLNTANGYGSTNTKIRRFTNTVTNQGTDITYADSATLGASFTINTNGVYAISFNDQYSAAANLGISLNTITPTTDIYSCAITEILCATITPVANFVSAICVTVYLPSGSVVRAHTGGIASGGTVSGCQFTITRVA